MTTAKDSLVSSDFYKALIETSGTGYIAIDTKERVVIFNQIAEEMMRISAEEVLGKPFSVLLEKTGNSDSLLLSTLNSNTGYDLVEATIESFSGPINVLAYTNLIRNEKGETIGAYLSIKDITPQKQLEDQMFQSEKFSAFGELAAGIAHEVRNPLTSIRGFLQLFDKSISIDDPKKSILEIILKEIDRANSIIKQFLLLTKPVIPIRKQADIHKIIKAVLSSLEGEATLNNVECKLIKDPELPPLFIDEEQIRQVILNIAKNGVYSMPNGGTLTIQSTYEEEFQRAQIIIADTGNGIDCATLEKIFDPFFTTRAEGTGLGLTVSYKIIQNHGGRIDVQSEVGVGTSFILTIPIVGF